MSDRSVSLHAQPIVVRAAKEADFPAVCALLAELGRPEVTPTSEDAVRSIYLRHIAEPGSAALIAEREGRAIGFIALHIRERLSQSRPEAWVPDLIVTATEHGRGAAQALVTRAIEIAREHGCYRLALESHYHRQRAHRFYEREGFTDAGKCFYIAL
jgi:GNAT superfamily N-acetyltransferase